ncbi:MAG: SIS domain-containing protein [Acidobacteriia bacterium]|nr:SIS domain-containing protein [Terriglobia bacterium]
MPVSVPLNLIEGPYLSDLLDQPQALQQAVDGLEESVALQKFARALGRGDYKRAVLTGMGSSLHALYPLYLALCQFGIPSQMVETSELALYMGRVLDEHTLLIVVSQSGRSAETIRLLGLTAGRIATIGVTNTPDSPLAAQSDAIVLMRAGQESTVSCKTYVTTLVALEWLSAVLRGADLTKTRAELQQAVPAAAAYLAGWRSHVETLLARLQGTKHVFITGRGRSLATAETGGLILKESAHFAAEGMSAAAFRHGPFEMLGRHVFVVVFEGDAAAAKLNRRLVEDIGAAGGQSVLVGEDAADEVFRLPRVPAPVRPVAEMLTVQMMSLALAAINGHQAGQFERAAKITIIE